MRCIAAVWPSLGGDRRRRAAQRRARRDTRAPTVRARRSRVDGDARRHPRRRADLELSRVRQREPAGAGARRAPVPGARRVRRGARRSRSSRRCRAASTRCAVRLGQRVEPGDRLVAVRSPDLVDLTKEIERQARRGSRARPRRSSGCARWSRCEAEPEKELVAAEQELRQAQLARAGGRAQAAQPVGRARRRDGLYWLTAPRAGVVVERDVLVGPGGRSRSQRAAAGHRRARRGDRHRRRARERRAPVCRSARRAQILPSRRRRATASTGTIEYDRRGRRPAAPHGRRARARAQPRARRCARTPSCRSRSRPATAARRRAGRGGGHRRSGVVRVRAHGRAARRRSSAARSRSAASAAARSRSRSGLAPGETYVTKGALLLLNAVDLAQPVSRRMFERIVALLAAQPRRGAVLHRSSSWSPASSPSAA